MLPEREGPPKCTAQERYEQPASAPWVKAEIGGSLSRVLQKGRRRCPHNTLDDTADETTKSPEEGGRNET